MAAFMALHPVRDKPTSRGARFTWAGEWFLLALPFRAGTTSRMKYYWDFFGPSAGRTAEHFREHLLQFFEKHGVEGAVTGCESEGDAHMAAYCVVPTAHAEAVDRALKPNRKRPSATQPQ